MYVYWIHLKHHSIKSEGYVGITRDPKRRFKEHQNLNKTSSIVSNAISKYKDEIVYDIIFEGSELACKTIEEYYRPTHEIGWNIVPGGGLPPILAGDRSPMKNPEVVKRAVEARRKVGYIITDAMKKAISESKLGKPIHENTKAALKKKWEERKTDPNFVHNRTKIANVYDRNNKCIALQVCLKHWCIANDLDFTGMAKTTKADRTLPASRNNRLYHKGYWAEYT